MIQRKMDVKLFFIGIISLLMFIFTAYTMLILINELRTSYLPIHIKYFLFILLLFIINISNLQEHLDRFLYIFFCK